MVGGAAADELRFGLRLDQLYPDRALNPEEIARDALSFVMAMDGHTDSRFVLQMLADPAGGGGDGAAVGRMTVHLLTTVTGVDGDAPSLDRVAELSDDLLDVLSAPPLRWGFSPVSDEAALRRAIEPVVPRYLAEIARREEPCSPVQWANGSPIGFGAATADMAEARTDRSLWSMWTLGPAAPDLRRLASVLLAQEAPVCVRILLRPTCLTDGERDGIERLLMHVAPVLPDSGFLRASLTTIEALLYLRPVFEVRCLVASPDPLSRSLLSAIGNSISQPSRHARTEGGQLEGGFSVVRGGTDVAQQVLLDAYERMTLGESIPSLATGGMERLRRLLGPWEAANVFRFPVTDDDFPGISSMPTPELEPPIRDLPLSGHRIGQLVAYGRRPVLLDSSERFRHLYISGQTGTGKSTLLMNLALQDIQAGWGVAVLDPHGDLVEALLHQIPDDRVDDVILVDPADQVAVVGVNLLEAETPVQEEYVVSELCNMFYELFDPSRQGIVGPRFETMMRQAALLLLAHPEQPSSLLDISTLFIDDAVRQHLARDIRDPILAEFWLGEMHMERSRDWQEVVSWFRSKFEIFRTSKLVRNVVGQAESTISFSDILRDRRILLVNLSKGLLGEYNSALIGHIVFARLWSAALERAALTREDRPDFFIYIDEFQNMTSESLPDVLSEARKFRVGMTLANQFFSQVPESTRDAIMGNVSNRVTFRVGPKDAGMFATWLGRAVHPDDLIRMPNYVGVAALSNSGVPLDPVVLQTDAPPESRGTDRAEMVRERSRAKWGRPVDELDRAFFARWRHVAGSSSSKLAAEPQRAEPQGSSFLDEWLARRRDAMQATLAVQGDPSENREAITALLRAAVPTLSFGDTKRILDLAPTGARVPGVAAESVESLVQDLRGFGLTVTVVDAAAGP